MNETQGPSNQGERFYATSPPPPQLRGQHGFMGPPTVEAVMKEKIRKSHGFQKTKNVFAFDDGLAEQQGPFITVTRPMLSALMLLDSNK